MPKDAQCAAAPSTGILAGPLPYWQSYGYDLTGNRTSDTRHDITGGADTVRTYTYPAAGQPQPHTLRTVDTTGPAGPSTASYGYDSAGNTTSRPGQTLGYDIEDHLASVTQGSATSSYVYDADGARLISHDSTGATAYLPFGVEVHADPSGTKSSTRYYTFGGLTVAMRTTAGVFFLGSDPHGTSTQTVSAANAAVTTRSFDPFGNLRAGATQPPWPSTHGFVNGPTDPTGLTHLGAREYDPTLGRFTSVDPILDPNDPQQLNGFAYAHNNPATNSDPTGRVDCGGPDGVNCQYFGYGKQGPKPPKNGTATSFQHGGITTTVTRNHTYVNSIELPESAPSSAQLADFLDGRLTQYRSRYEKAYGRALGEPSLDELIVLMLGCRAFCSREFEQWLLSVHALLTGDATRARFAVRDGAPVLALGSALSDGQLVARLDGIPIADPEGVVYRGLREGENPSRGLSARAPGASDVSPISHVAGKADSPWISTSKSFEVALNKYGKNGVVAIDLSRVPSEIVDISGGFPNGPVECRPGR